MALNDKQYKIYTALYTLVRDAAFAEHMQQANMSAAVEEMRRMMNNDFLKIYES